MFVTSEDFNIIPLDIPNLSEREDQFAPFVEQEEEGALIKLLGDSLYSSFIGGLAVLPAAYDSEVEYVPGNLVTSGVSIWECLTTAEGEFPIEGVYWTKIEDNKWLKLKVGDTYTYRDHPQLWKGMKNLLKPFIYSQWTRYDANRNTGIGVVKPAGENSNSVSAAQRISESFNKFSRIAGGKGNQYGTLYGYLVNKNIEDPSIFDGTFDSSFQNFQQYFDYKFKQPGTINIFGL